VFEFALQPAAGNPADLGEDGEAERRLNATEDESRRPVAPPSGQGRAV
jgi:hypothetical protein